MIYNYKLLHNQLLHNPINDKCNIIHNIHTCISVGAMRRKTEEIIKHSTVMKVVIIYVNLSNFIKTTNLETTLVYLYKNKII